MDFAAFPSPEDDDAGDRYLTDLSRKYLARYFDAQPPITDDKLDRAASRAAARMLKKLTKVESPRYNERSRGSVTV